MGNVIQETTPETAYPEGWEKSFYEEKVEAAIASIKEHVKLIGAHESEMWAAIKKLMGPSLLDISSPRRGIVLAAHNAIEETMYAMGRQTDALQASVRVIGMCSRLSRAFESQGDNDEDALAVAVVEGEHHE